MCGRKLVVSKFTVILELLGDGKWHGTEELLLRAELNEQKLQEITGFLSKYGFVKVDVKSRKVKINKDFKKLLVQTVT
jgi:predicted transcriptional regulator